MEHIQKPQANNILIRVEGDGTVLVTGIDQAVTTIKDQDADMKNLTESVPAPLLS
jgi:hypothetical protein